MGKKIFSLLICFVLIVSCNRARPHTLGKVLPEIKHQKIAVYAYQVHERYDRNYLNYSKELTDFFASGLKSKNYNVISFPMSSELEKFDYLDKSRDWRCNEEKPFIEKIIEYSKKQSADVILYFWHFSDVSEVISVTAYDTMNAKELGWTRSDIIGYEFSKTYQGNKIIHTAREITIKPELRAQVKHWLLSKF